MSVIENSIRVTLELSEETRAAEAKPAERDGADTALGLKMSSENMLDMVLTTIILDDELEAYLSKLSLDILQRIWAIMCAGRGDGSAESMKLIAPSKKQEIIDLIVNLTPSLPVYFKQGLEVTKKQGFNIDTF